MSSFANYHRAPFPPQEEKAILSGLNIQNSHLLGDPKSANSLPPLFPPIQLPPIQADERSAALQHIPQQIPSPHSVPPPPLSKLPVSRLSTGFEDLISLPPKDKASTDGRQYNGDEQAFPQTAPTLPSIFIRKPSPEDITLTSTAAASSEKGPRPPSQSVTLGSPYRPGYVTTSLPTSTINRGFLQKTSISTRSDPLPPSNTKTTPKLLPTAHVSSPPRPHHQSEIVTALASQSFLSVPLASTSPACTMPRLDFHKAFCAPTLGALGPSQYQTKPLETGQDLIPIIPNIAGDTRMRKLNASRRYRQRCNGKKQETLVAISKLEAQIQAMVNDKEQYRQERDFLKDLLLQNGVAIPPRAASPRQRKRASLANYKPQQYMMRREVEDTGAKIPGLLLHTPWHQTDRCHYRGRT